jgi:hypothetical protein
MLKEKILKLYQALNTLGNLRGVKFAYFVVKNLNILKPEIEALQKSLEPSGDYNAYDAERVELAKKFAKKDEKGNPVVENNSFVLEDKDGFDKELKGLVKKHKTALDIREKQISEYNELLKEETKVELYKVKLADVPEDITTEQMAGIFEMVEDEKV